MQKTAKQTSRLEYLDYLRGYFIVVILVDHLWRYPSLFAVISGEARLWMTAAEGFMIISGFMIGYVRGYKGLKTPLKTIAAKLFKRSLVLYAAMALASFAYISIEWSGLVKGMPYTPMSNYIQSWGVAINDVLTMEHPHTWVHFLALYAVFLVASIPVVWLLRNKKAWLVAAISVATYAVGLQINNEWMVWQILFFIPSIGGFYYDNVRTWWSRQSRIDRRMAYIILLSYFILSVTVSAVIAFHPSVLSRPVFSALDTQFTADTLWPARIANSLLWFTALAVIFRRITPQLKKLTRGVLGYIGSHSLQMYLVHGLAICLITLTLPDSNSWIINTFYDLILILGTYWLIRLPIIRRLLPS